MGEGARRCDDRRQTTYFLAFLYFSGCSGLYSNSPCLSKIFCVIYSCFFLDRIRAEEPLAVYSNDSEASSHVSDSLLLLLSEGCTLLSLVRGAAKFVPSSFLVAINHKVKQRWGWLIVSTYFYSFSCILRALLSVTLVKELSMVCAVVSMAACSTPITSLDDAFANLDVI